MRNSPRKTAATSCKHWRRSKTMTSTTSWPSSCKLATSYITFKISLTLVWTRDISSRFLDSLQRQSVSFTGKTSFIEISKLRTCLFRIPPERRHTNLQISESQCSWLLLQLNSSPSLELEDILRLRSFKAKHAIAQQTYTVLVQLYICYSLPDFLFRIIISRRCAEKLKKNH